MAGRDPAIQGNSGSFSGVLVGEVHALRGGLICCAWPPHQPRAHFAPAPAWGNVFNDTNGKERGAEQRGKRAGRTKGSEHLRRCSSKIYGVPAAFDIALTWDFHLGGCGEPRGRPLRMAHPTLHPFPLTRPPPESAPHETDVSKVRACGGAGISFSKKITGP